MGRAPLNVFLTPTPCLKMGRELSGARDHGPVAIGMRRLQCPWGTRRSTVTLRTRVHSSVNVWFSVNSQPLKLIKVPSRKLGIYYVTNVCFFPSPHAGILIPNVMVLGGD